jgi:hypothetical protein
VVLKAKIRTAILWSPRDDLEDNRVLELVFLPTMGYSDVDFQQEVSSGQWPHAFHLPRADSFRMDYARYVDFSRMQSVPKSFIKTERRTCRLAREVLDDLLDHFAKWVLS